MRTNRNYQTLDRFVDQFLNNQFNNNQAPKSFVPAVNITESEKNYLLELSVPGFSKALIKLEIKEDSLVVSGNREVEKKEGINIHRSEIPAGEFKKSFVLPKTVNREEVQANFQDGILTVELPKLATKVKNQEIVIA